MKKSAAAEGFVPFDPLPHSAPPPDSGSRLTVVPKSDAKPDFSPFQGAPGTQGHGAHSAHSAKASTTPVVTLERDGDRVTGIRIECSCGQVIELACSY